MPSLNIFKSNKLKYPKKLLKKLLNSFKFNLGRKKNFSLCFPIFMSRRRYNLLRKSSSTVRSIEYAYGGCHQIVMELSLDGSLGVNKTNDACKEVDGISSTGTSRGDWDFYASTGGFWDDECSSCDDVYYRPSTSRRWSI